MQRADAGNDKGELEHEKHMNKNMNRADSRNNKGE